eukprot:TRINITY_DN8019_c0_g1_i1.p1 TRINITY_DN8019_c0_g1~~TRINITY_DN8019_c0_g1_i1.p1  ORF type:complete len:711 (+),score=97.97 TRINITY_DN8019_c0_g1_i1:128-2260(+)
MSDAFEFFEGNDDDQQENGAENEIIDESTASFPATLADCAGKDLYSVLGAAIPAKLPLSKDTKNKEYSEDVVVENSFLIKRPKIDTTQTIKPTPLPWVKQQNRLAVGRQSNMSIQNAKDNEPDICPNTGLSLSAIKRKGRIFRCKSAFTSEEHAAFRKNVPREHAPLLILERGRFQTWMENSSITCSVCKFGSSTDHIHLNQTWLLPHIRSCFLMRIPRSERPLPEHTQIATCELCKPTGTPPPTRLSKYIGHFGQICSYSTCSTVPDSVPHQINVFESPFDDVQYNEKTSISGIDNGYLHFPAARSKELEASEGNGTPGRRKKSCAEIEWEKEKNRVPSPEARFKKKQSKIPLSEDGVINQELTSGSGIKIVCSPATAAKIAGHPFSHHGHSIMVEAKMIAGECVLFLNKPQKVGSIRPRTVNESFFKNALLSDGIKVSSSMPFGQEEPKTEEWDPSVAKASPSQNTNDYHNYSYSVFMMGGMSVLFRGRIHCMHQGMPTLVRANMEYNCGLDPILVPDDPRSIIHERLTEAAYINLYCGLKFRALPGCKTLTGRVNAHTSSVVGWECTTLEQLDDNAYKTKAVSNNAINSTIQTVFSFLLTNILKEGSYLVQLSGRSTTGKTKITIDRLQVPPPIGSSLGDLIIDNNQKACYEEYQPMTAWFHDRNLPFTFPHPNKYNLPHLFPEYPDETVSLSRVLVHDDNVCREIR